MVELQSLFDISSGTPLYLNRSTQANNGIPFVTRGSKNNGVVAHVKPVAAHRLIAKGTITVAPSGCVLEAFLQPAPFYTSSNQLCLAPKKGVDLSENEKLYYCLCIRANKFRYSYSRQAHRTLKGLKVPAPDKIPAWVYDLPMHLKEDIREPICAAPPKDINTQQWKYFKLDNLFEIKSGKSLPASKRTQGSTPLISARGQGNGLLDYVGQPPAHRGGVLTVNYGGCAGEVFFQDKPFWGSGDVNVLYPTFKMTPLAALFVATVLRQEHTRYNYGRKCSVGRMKQAKIKLPAKSDGAINISYMESYIKGLSYSRQAIL